MNNVIDTIMARRTIRAYKPDPLTKEQLETLMHVALTSPTAMNAQTWHFSVLQDSDLISEYENDIVEVIMNSGNEAMIERTKGRNNKVIYDAPLLVVLSAKPSSYAHVDAGIAVQSLAIAAKSMGLDSVILGMPGLVFNGAKKDYWKEKLGFPPEFEFTISIAIGYGNMEPGEKALDSTKITHVK